MISPTTPAEISKGALFTSDKACYVPHGAETGAPDDHNACILCEAAQGVRCARAGRWSGGLGHPDLFPIMAVYRKEEETCRWPFLSLSAGLPSRCSGTTTQQRWDCPPVRGARWYE